MSSVPDTVLEWLTSGKLNQTEDNVSVTRHRSDIIEPKVREIRRASRYKR